MQVQKRDSTSEELLFLTKRKTRKNPIFVAIFLVVIVSIVAMTGVFLEYW